MADHAKATDLNARIRGLVEQLATETDAARQSELFMSYLKAVGSFHNYSWHNQMSIWMHRPNATRVAGFQTWKKLGRFVKAGSKGIPILAPMIFNERDRDTGEERKRIWFKIVYVFDIAQTDGKALPSLPQSCSGDGSDLLAVLSSYVRSLGIQLTFAETGQALGYCCDKGTKITVSDKLDDTNRAAVLIHEVSHALLHFGASKPNLKQRELEAEATAFVVASHFGLNPQSNFYLASYDVKASDLIESLETIQKTASQIINACSESQDSEQVSEVAA